MVEKTAHLASGSRCQDLCSDWKRICAEIRSVFVRCDPIESNTTNPALPGNQRRRKERVGTMQVSGFVRRLDQLLHCSVDRAASSAMWVPGGTRVRYGMLQCGPVQVQSYKG